MASPPPAGSKKLVLKLRSVNNIVKPEPNTGKDKINKNEVVAIHTGNKCVCHMVLWLTHLLFRIQLKKFILPSKLPKPAVCRANILHSTEQLEWPTFELRGGYSVQPVPEPPSI